MTQVLYQAHIQTDTCRTLVSRAVAEEKNFGPVRVTVDQGGQIVSLASDEWFAIRDAVDMAYQKFTARDIGMDEEEPEEPDAPE